MLEALKVIIFGIVEGITEWLPISSTGHLILLEELLHLKQNQAFLDMFYVVIQLGAILAVVVMYFHKLNPFSPKKTQKQKMLTIQLWVKVIIGSIPAMLIGLPFNDFIEEKFNNSYVVAATLIIYGILFIVIENYQKDKQPKVEKLSQLTIQTVLIIGVFQALALIPGTSRSGATIVGALLIGVSRGVAAITFFAQFRHVRRKFLKLIKFGLNFTGMQVFLLLLGTVVSFAVSILAIKFLMQYIRKHDFKVFGYYRIVLGVIVLLYFGIKTLLA
ncbi:MAG: undecaprenyl-diphosphate phosphatase [[Ruminococcus] torques]